MKTVEDIMTKVPIVASVPGSRSDAINILVRNNLTGVPVVRADNGNLVGIVSRKDIFNNFEEDQLSLIMQKNILTIPANATIKKAAKLFVDNRIHRLPVVDGKTLIGLITPTDLLDDVRKTKTKLKAEDILKTTCVTAYEEDPLSYVITAMRVSKCTSFPVLDADGALVGIITDRDMFLDQADTDALEELGVEDSEESLEGYRNVLPLFYMISDEHGISNEHLVKDYMVSNPVSVFKKTSLSEVAKIMKEENFGQIPVLGDKDELIGMIYDVDVLAALL